MRRGGFSPNRRTRRNRSRTTPVRLPGHGPARGIRRSLITLGSLIALIAFGGAVLMRGLPVEQMTQGELPPVAVDAEVVRIIDGDTLDVRTAQSGTVRVRLYGIDAAERGEPCHTEAAERLGELAGAQVHLVPDARLTDRFGRALRYVYDDSGRSIDETLIREGLARAWRDDGTQRDTLVALETAARASSAGCLWGTR